jgi:hypothetical protein
MADIIHPSDVSVVTSVMSQEQSLLNNEGVSKWCHNSSNVTGGTPVT